MNKPKILVSVVTPAYNAEKFIEETIISIKNQNYVNIEHIIIDDGSTDNTPKILKKYENKYNLIWFSKPNEGQTITVNKGFELANGDIVIWLNADDVLFDKNVISYIVEQFEKYPSVNVIYGDRLNIDENNKLINILHRIPWFSFNRLLRDHFAAFIFFRKNVIKNYKLDPTIDLPMDYEHALRMAKSGLKFKHVNKILFAYRSHSQTKTLSRWDEMEKETMKIKKMYGLKLGYKYKIMKKIDMIIYLFLEFYGVITLTNLYLNRKKKSYAFSIKFDPYIKTLFRQTPLLRRFYK
jgi:glycosyltransferase involved in cell wall biosynthesis